MKKGLSKLLGITLLCATIISGGALISHLALSRNAENNVVQNNNNNNQSSKLVSAKHKFLTATYDFRNQVNSPRKFKNNDEGDMQSLMNFIGGSNKNVYDEDSPMLSQFGSFESSQVTRIDEDTQEEITETVYSYENVYKGNGGLRIGTNSGDNESYFHIYYSSLAYGLNPTSIKMYVTSYNTVINNVNHYDTASFYINNQSFNINGSNVIEAYLDAQSFLSIDLTHGRLIIYQIDIMFDWCEQFDFMDINDLPKGVGYSYESIGSFKYFDLDGEIDSVVYNSETNHIELVNHNLSHDEVYQSILMYNDGDYQLYNDDFNWLVILKDYNFVLKQKDDVLRLPDDRDVDILNSDSQFYVFRKVTSLDPYGPQY